MNDMTLENALSAIESEADNIGGEYHYVASRLCEAVESIRSHLAKAAQPVEAADEHMSIAVALSFADDPRPYHSLAAPADTNGELYRALSVLAREYRAALANPRPTGGDLRIAPVEKERFEAWMKRGGGNTRKRDDGVYADHTIMCCWNAWWMSASFKTDTSLTTVPYALADLVRAVRRFDEDGEDGEDVNLSRGWFDALTTLGLLTRVQRSPARWEMTDSGRSLLSLAAPTGEQAGEVAWIDHTPSGVVLHTLGECKRLEDLPHGTKLYAQPRPTVPDGYRLVPVEPTEAMVGRLTSAIFESYYAYQYALMNPHTSKPFWQKAIKAMLAAAPDGEVG